MKTINVILMCLTTFSASTSAHKDKMPDFSKLMDDKTFDIAQQLLDHIKDKKQDKKYKYESKPAKFDVNFEVTHNNFNDVYDDDYHDHHEVDNHHDDNHHDDYHDDHDHRVDNNRHQCKPPPPPPPRSCKQNGKSRQSCHRQSSSCHSNGRSQSSCHRGHGSRGPKGHRGHGGRGHGKGCGGGGRKGGGGYRGKRDVEERESGNDPLETPDKSSSDLLLLDTLKKSTASIKDTAGSIKDN